VSGLTADLLGIRPAVGLVALLTLASGAVVALRLRETRRPADDQPISRIAAHATSLDTTTRALPKVSQ
jgi:hypothetical protein